MKNSETISKILSNGALFNLIENDDTNIPDELKQFLLECKFPWHALGKPLTNFIRAFIEKCPKDQRIRGKVSPYAVIDDTEPVIIAEGAEVDAHTFISGPTFIGPGAAVRQGAYVRGSVFLCEGSVIGHTTEAKGAILLPRAKAAHFAYVGDSILGSNTNLGAGTKLANLRFDHKEVFIHIDGQKVSTGLKKFGAILGNGAQTGCNSVTNPGTILMPNSHILPNTTAKGIVEFK